LNSISKAISKFTLFAIKLYFIVTLSVVSVWVFCDLTEDGDRECSRNVAIYWLFNYFKTGRKSK